LEITNALTWGNYEALVTNNATLIFNLSQTQNLNGGLTGTTGKLVKQGVGLLALSGTTNDVKTLSVEGGTVAFSAASNLTILDNTDADKFGVETGIRISGGGVLQLTGGNTVTVASVKTGAASVGYLEVDDLSGVLALTSFHGNDGEVFARKTGSGTLRLDGRAGSASIRVEAGVVALNGDTSEVISTTTAVAGLQIAGETSVVKLTGSYATQIAETTVVGTEDGGTLDLNGHANRIAGLIGESGVVTNTHASAVATLALGAAAGDRETAFGGDITGKVNLVLHTAANAGGGVLSGAGSSYSGATRLVEASTWNLASLGKTSGVFLEDAGAVLNFSPVDADDAAVSGSVAKISGAGTFTKNGGGLVVGLVPEGTTTAAPGIVVGTKADGGGIASARLIVDAGAGELAIADNASLLFNLNGVLASTDDARLTLRGESLFVGTGISIGWENTGTLLTTDNVSIALIDVNSIPGGDAILAVLSTGSAPAFVRTTGTPGATFVSYRPIENGVLYLRTAAGNSVAGTSNNLTWRGHLVVNGLVWGLDDNSSEYPNWVGNVGLDGVNTYLNGDTVIFDGYAENGAAAGNIVAVANSGVLPAAVVVDNLADRPVVIVSTGAVGIGDYDSTHTVPTTLAKSGAGKLTLAGANTFTGDVTLEAGTLAIATTASLGDAGDAAGTAAVVLNGGVLEYTSAVTTETLAHVDVSGAGVGDGGAVFVAEGGVLTVAQLTAANTQTAAAFVKAGPGKLILTAATNGRLTLAGGELDIGGAALDALTIAKGASEAEGAAAPVAKITSGTAFAAGAVAVVGVGTLDLNGHDFSVGSLDGAVSTGSLVTNTVSGAAVTLTLGGGSYAGTIGGNVNLVLDGTGGTLAGATATTHTGATTVSNNATWAVTAAATLGGTSGVVLGGANAVLAVGEDVAAFSLAALSGAGTLTKDGGALSLGSTSNAAGGKLFVTGTNGATLAFAANAAVTFDLTGLNATETDALLTLAGASLTIGAGASFGYANDDNSRLETAGTSIVLVDATGIADTASAATALGRFASSEAPNFVRTASVAGTTTGVINYRLVDAGKLVLHAETKTQSDANTTLTWGGGSDGFYQNVWVNDDGTAFAPYWAGTVVTSGDALTYLDGDVVVFPASAAVKTITVSGGGVKPASVLVTNAEGAANAYTLTSAASGVGIGNFDAGTPTALTKTGAGTLTLAGQNTFTGGVDVQAGTVIVSADASLGGAAGALTLGNGAVAGTVQLGAAVTLARALVLAGTEGGIFDTAGFDGEVSGAVNGSVLTKIGSGVLTLSGAGNTVSAVDLQGGSLVAASGLAASGGVGVGNGATLLANAVLSATATVASGGVLGGTGSVSEAVLSAGATLAPGANAGAIGTLTLGAADAETALAGVVLKLDLRGSADDGPASNDRANVVGSAVYGAGNTLDLSGVTSAGVALNTRWAEGDYVILQAAEGVAVAEGALAGTVFKYKGVALNPETRGWAALAVAESGNELVLTTHLDANAALAWSEAGEELWTNATGALAGWTGNNSSPDSFRDGDLVTFDASASVQKNVYVDDQGLDDGGVVTGGMAVTGSGAFVFRGGKIVGVDVGTKGSYVVSTGALSVSAGATATFYSGVDFVDIGVSGAAVFYGEVSAANALAIYADAVVTLGDGAVLTGLAGVANGGTLRLVADAESLAETSVLATPVSGVGGVEKSGSGRFVLSGANSYSGATAVQGGVLEVGAAASLAGTSGVAVSPGATLDLNFAAAGTLAPDVSGTGGVAVSGAEVTFAAAKTYSGATAIDGGALRLAVVGALPNSLAVSVVNGSLALDAAGALAAAARVTVGTGGAISATGAQIFAGLSLAADATSANFGGADLTLTGSVAVASAGTIGRAVAGLGVVTLGSTAAGSAAAPVLVLTGADALASASAVRITRGTVNATADQGFAALTVAAGAALSGEDAVFTVASGEISGAFSGAGAGLVKTGGAGDVLTLNTAVAATGAVRVEGGVLSLAVGNALAANSAVSVSAGASLATAAAQTFAALSVAAGGGADFGGAAVSITGFRVLSGLEVAAAGASVISAPLANTGAVSIGVAGASAGVAPVVTLAGANAFPDAPVVTLAAGSLTVAAAQTFAVFNSAAGTATALNGATLFLGGGVLAGDLSGDTGGVFRKNTGGALVLSGDNTGFAGAIEVLGGVVTLASDDNLGTGANTVDGAELVLTGTAYGKSWAVGTGGATVTLAAPVAFSGAFSGAGALEKRGAGVLTLATASTHAGETRVLGGGLELAATNALAQSAGLFLEGASATASASQVLKNLVVPQGRSLVFAASAAAEDRNLAVGTALVSGVLANVHDLVKTGAGELNLASASAAAPLVLDGVLEVQGGTVRVALDPAGPSVRARTVEFAAEALLDITGFYEGSIGNGAFSEPVANTLILTAEPIGPDAFPVRYVVAGNAGQDFASVQLARGIADRSVLVTAGLAWNDDNRDGEGDFDRAQGTFTVVTEFTLGVVLADRTPGFVSALGWDGKSITKDGPGVLTLTANNTFTGTARVLEGELRVTGLLGTLPFLAGVQPAGDYAGTIELGSGSALVLDQVSNQTLRGVLTGAEGSSITKNGVGVLTLAGAVHLENGTLAIGPDALADVLGAARIGTLAVEGRAVFAAAGGAGSGGSDVTNVGALTVAAKGGVDFAGPVALGTAQIAGTANFGGDVEIASPFFLNGVKARVTLAEGATLTLRQGGTLEGDLLGTGWTVRNVAGEFTANAIAGRLENAGTATVSGAIEAGAVNAAAARLEVAGTINGGLDNAGWAHVQGLIRGGVVNRAGSTLWLENARERTDIFGTLQNDGIVWFQNIGHKLSVGNLTNVTAGGVGYYSLDVDAARPATSDHVEITAGGKVTGTHVFDVRWSNLEALTSGTKIELIRAAVIGEDVLAGANVQDGVALAKAVVRLAAPVDSGLSRFDVAPGTATVQAVGPSTVSQAIIGGGAATLGAGWFNQLDSLGKRFGDLRLESGNAVGGREGAAGADVAGSKVARAKVARAAEDTEHFWLRVHGQQAKATLSGLTAFRESQYGGDLGVDHAFALPADAKLYLGVAAGYQSSHRTHDGSGAKGDVDAPSAAIYASYLHPAGFYADGVLQGQYADSEFKIRDEAGNSDRAQYENYTLGVSLEAGWQVRLPHGFTLTPAAQLAYGSVFGTSYDTDNGIHAVLDKAEVLRWGVGLTLAKAFVLADGGILQPSLRLGYDEQTTYGGAVRAEYQGDRPQWHPSTNGGRTSIGVALAWQLSDSQQLHLDYEGSWGTRYDVPWNINAGWRLRF
jgi:outer membrane autotransporter protein